MKLFFLLKKKIKNLDLKNFLIINKKIQNLKIFENFDIDKYDLIINFVNHDIFKDKILKIKKKKKKYLDLF